MNGNQVVSNLFAALPSNPDWTVQGVSDFNGDGMADVLLRYGLNNSWRLYTMNGNQVVSNLFAALPSSPDWTIRIGK